MTRIDVDMWIYSKGLVRSSYHRQYPRFYDTFLRYEHFCNGRVIDVGGQAKLCQTDHSIFERFQDFQLSKTHNIAQPRGRFTTKVGGRQKIIWERASCRDNYQTSRQLCISFPLLLGENQKSTV
ncbi:hypothetical protein FRC18_012171 [Serendipita sp. 400]|nr:hypothetical protein FRC18_012171 [Serendipita sp. 400]